MRTKLSWVHWPPPNKSLGHDHKHGIGSSKRTELIVTSNGRFVMTHYDLLGTDGFGFVANSNNNFKVVC